MLCIASMIFSAISFVAFLAIVSTSSPVFISEAPASISVSEVGQVLKRRHLKLEYREALLLKAFDPLGHFWQGLHEQGSGISSESQSQLIFAFLLHFFCFLCSHFPFGLTWGASRGSPSSSSGGSPLPLPLLISKSNSLLKSRK